MECKVIWGMSALPSFSKHQILTCIFHSTSHKTELFGGFTHWIRLTLSRIYQFKANYMFMLMYNDEKGSTSNWTIHINHLAHLQLMYFQSYRVFFNCQGVKKGKGICHYSPNNLLSALILFRFGSSQTQFSLPSLLRGSWGGDLWICGSFSRRQSLPSYILLNKNSPSICSAPFLHNHESHLVPYQTTRSGIGNEPSNTDFLFFLISKILVSLLEHQGLVWLDKVSASEPNSLDLDLRVKKMQRETIEEEEENISMWMCEASQWLKALFLSLSVSFILY